MINYTKLEEICLGKVRNLIYTFQNKSNIEELARNNVISSEEIPGAIPAYITNEDSKIILRYHISKEEVLSEYVKNNITKNKLLKILINILNIFINAKQKGIKIENYLLNINNVYIDRESCEISYIYIPGICDSNEDFTIKKYLKEILSNVVYDTNDDLHFFISLHNYLNSDVEDEEEILNYINSKVDKCDREVESVLDNGKFKIEDNEDKLMSIHIKTNNVNLKNNNYYYDSSDKYFQKDDLSDCGTIVLDEDETTLLDSEEDNEVNPILLRKSTEETFEINKNKINIGRESSYCDFIITNNKLIGRLHAIITKKGQDYFIEDNYSTNGTFINSKRIEKMKKYKIEHGDEIKLSNEVFLFINGEQ